MGLYYFLSVSLLYFIARTGIGAKFAGKMGASKVLIFLFHFDQVKLGIRNGRYKASKLLPMVLYEFF